jgi:hypothetical protein
MSKTASPTAALPHELPVRKDHGSIEEAGREASRLGRDAEAIARDHSGDEWVCDSWRAEGMQESLGLDDAQLLAVLTALVERNRSIWGPCCAASLTPWYSDLIESVKALSKADSPETRCG